MKRMKLMMKLFAFAGIFATASVMHATNQNTPVTIKQGGGFNEVDINKPTELGRIIINQPTSKYECNEIIIKKREGDEDKWYYIPKARWAQLDQLQQAVRSVQNTMISSDIADQLCENANKKASESFQKVMNRRLENFKFLVLDGGCLLGTIDIYQTMSSTDQATSLIEQSVDDTSSINPWISPLSKWQFKADTVELKDAVTRGMIRVGCCAWMNGASFDEKLTTLKECLAKIHKNEGFAGKHGLPAINAGSRKERIKQLIEKVKTQRDNIPNSANSVNRVFDLDRMQQEIDLAQGKIEAWADNTDDSEAFAGIAAAYLGTQFLMMVTIDHSNFYYIPKA